MAIAAVEIIVPRALSSFTQRICLADSCGWFEGRLTGTRSVKRKNRISVLFDPNTFEPDVGGNVP